jgi:type I restriction enzyme, R subunit
MSSRPVSTSNSGLSNPRSSTQQNSEVNKPGGLIARPGLSAPARRAETEIVRFPNAKVNADERRKLRAALYRPLLGLDKEERGRVVDIVLAILLDGDRDADA